MIAIRPDAEAHAQDALLARRQACEHLGGGLTQIGLDRGIEWRDRVLVLDEIAQAAVLLLANRQVKAERLLGDIQHLAHPFERHRQLLRKLFGGRLAADLAPHLPRRLSQLSHRVDHVHRDADRARLRSEEHTSELQSRRDLVCRLLLEKKKKTKVQDITMYNHIVTRPNA